jgi:invasion protein IalB
MPLRNWVLFLVMLAALPLRAMAADGVNASGAALSSTEWRVECGNNGKALDCQIINHIFQQGGAEIASIAVHPGASGSPSFALVQLPLGIALNAPVLLSVGSAPAAVLTLNTCLQQGCIASVALTSGFVAELVAGAKLTLSFGMANSRTLTLAVPLTGFDLAYHYVARQ